ncbi:MAG: hypothetical protein KatS3mg013_0471 [Actinomycetota bacterium]|nr:MAG: hypothetical protein KatS3mg013_0471 [Actinomycetota bacterium]
MTIPDFQTIMLPLLKLAGDGREALVPRGGRDARRAVTAVRGGTEGAVAERAPADVRQPRAVGATYLAQAGLLQAPRRGWFRITDRGREVLGEAPARITVEFLERFEEFRSFRERRRPQGRTPSPSPEVSPEEALEEAHQQLRRALMAELLKLVKASSARPSSSGSSSTSSSPWATGDRERRRGVPSVAAGTGASTG